MAFKNFFTFLEKKYSAILVFISLVSVILLFFLYWTLYSNIMLKELEAPEDIVFEEKTLDKTIQNISQREQNQAQSQKEEYRDVFK